MSTFSRNAIDILRSAENALSGRPTAPSASMYGTTATRPATSDAWGRSSPRPFPSNTQRRVEAVGEDGAWGQRFGGGGGSPPSSPDTVTVGRDALLDMQRQLRNGLQEVAELRSELAAEREHRSQTLLVLGKRWKEEVLVEMHGAEHRMRRDIAELENSVAQRLQTDATQAAVQRKAIEDLQRLAKVNDRARFEQQESLRDTLEELRGKVEAATAQSASVRIDCTQQLERAKAAMEHRLDVELIRYTDLHRDEQRELQAVKEALKEEVTSVQGRVRELVNETWRTASVALEKSLREPLETYGVDVKQLKATLQQVQSGVDDAVRGCQAESRVQLITLKERLSALESSDAVLTSKVDRAEKKSDAAQDAVARIDAAVDVAKEATERAAAHAQRAVERAQRVEDALADRDNRLVQVEGHLHGVASAEKLKGEIEACRRTVARVESQMDSIKVVSDRGEGLVERATRQVEAMTERVAQCERTVAKSQQTVSDATERVESCLQRVTAVEDTRDAMQGAVERQERLGTALEQRMASSENRLRLLGDKVEKGVRDALGSQQALSVRVEAAHELASRVESVSTTAKAEVDRLEKRVLRVEASSSTFTAEVTSIRAEVDEQTKEVVAVRESQQQLKEQLNQHEALVEDRLTMLDQFANGYTERVSQLEHHMGRQLGEFGQHTDDRLAALENHLKETPKQLQHLIDRQQSRPLGELQQRLRDVLEKEVRPLQKRVSTLEESMGDVEDTQQRFDTRFAQVSALESLRGALRALDAQIRSSNEGLRQQLTGTQERQVEVDNRLRLIEANQGRSKEGVQKLQLDVVQCADDIAAMQQNVQLLVQQQQQLARRVAAVANESAAARSFSAVLTSSPATSPMFEAGGLALGGSAAAAAAVVAGGALPSSRAAPPATSPPHGKNSFAPHDSAHNVTGTGIGSGSGSTVGGAVVSAPDTASTVIATGERGAGEAGHSSPSPSISPPRLNVTVDDSAMAVAASPSPISRPPVIVSSQYVSAASTAMEHTNVSPSRGGFGRSEDAVESLPNTAVLSPPTATMDVPGGSTPSSHDAVVAVESPSVPAKGARATSPPAKAPPSAPPPPPVPLFGGGGRSASSSSSAKSAGAMAASTSAARAGGVGPGSGTHSDVKSRLSSVSSVHASGDGHLASGIAGTLTRDDEDVSMVRALERVTSAKPSTPPPGTGSTEEGQGGAALPVPSMLLSPAAEQHPIPRGDRRGTATEEKAFPSGSQLAVGGSVTGASANASTLLPAGDAVGEERSTLLSRTLGPSTSGVHTAIQRFNAQADDTTSSTTTSPMRDTRQANVRSRVVDDEQTEDISITDVTGDTTSLTATDSTPARGKPSATRASASAAAGLSTTAPVGFRASSAADATTPSAAVGSGVTAATTTAAATAAAATSQSALVVGSHGKAADAPDTNSTVSSSRRQGSSASGRHRRPVPRSRVSFQAAWTNSSSSSSENGDAEKVKKEAAAATAIPAPEEEVESGQRGSAPATAPRRTSVEKPEADDGGNDDDDDVVEAMDANAAAASSPSVAATEDAAESESGMRVEHRVPQHLRRHEEVAHDALQTHTPTTANYDDWDEEDEEETEDAHGDDRGGGTEDESGQVDPSYVDAAEDADHGDYEEEEEEEPEGDGDDVSGEGDAVHPAGKHGMMHVTDPTGMEEEEEYSESESDAVQPLNTTVFPPPRATSTAATNAAAQTATRAGPAAAGGRAGVGATFFGVHSSPDTSPVTEEPLVAITTTVKAIGAAGSQQRQPLSSATPPVRSAWSAATVGGGEVHVTPRKSFVQSDSEDEEDTEEVVDRSRRPTAATAVGGASAIPRFGRTTTAAAAAASTSPSSASSRSGASQRTGGNEGSGRGAAAVPFATTAAATVRTTGARTTVPSASPHPRYTSFDDSTSDDEEDG